MYVLIIEDDRETAEALALTVTLQWAAGEVRTARDGQEAMETLAERMPELVLLDVGLPRRDGFEVLRALRQTSQTPVLLITGRVDELDKVRGLELGADDYITKPFSHLELLARIKAVLRRSVWTPCGTESGPAFRDGYLDLDFASREFRAGGRPVTLTPTESNLLAFLVRNAGRTVPHAALLARVWGEEYESECDYLRVYVRRLREKLEQNAERPEYLVTDRGVGYRFQSVRRETGAAS